MEFLMLTINISKIFEKSDIIIQYIEATYLSQV